MTATEMAQTDRSALSSAVESDVIIHINGLNKWFGEFHVLRDIDLSVMSKERIVICGPSGSGKSTLIRCINRLEEHQEGDIIVDGVTLDKNLKNIDQVRKDVGMVFQSFNLFPHLTVLQNCTLAPRRRPWSACSRSTSGSTTSTCSSTSIWRSRPASAWWSAGRPARASRP